MLRLPGAWLARGIGMGLNMLHLIAPAQASTRALALFCTPRRRNPPAPEHAALLASAQRETLHAGSREVVCWRWPAPTPGGAARAVVLAHGWESCSGRLAEWVTPLRDAGFEVLAVDAPAHGESPGEHLTAIDYAMALAGLIEAARQRDVVTTAVIGHSFGGFCAALAVGGTGLATPAPCDHVVLIGAPASVSGLLQRFAQLLGLRPALVRDVAALIEARSGIAMADLRSDAALRGWGGRVLLVHDTRDQEVPYTDAEQVAQRLARADLYTTTGQGHRRVARNHHVIRHVVNALAST